VSRVAVRTALTDLLPGALVPPPARTIEEPDDDR
jgi:hypothetical protein